MKKFLFAAAILLTLMIAIPFLALSSGKGAYRETLSEAVESAVTTDNKEVSVYDSESKQTENMDRSLLILSIVCAKADKSFCPQAISALSTAVNTKLEYISSRENTSEPQIDFENPKEYTPPETVKEILSDRYDEFLKIASDSADNIISYDGKPINAEVFYCCSGVTNRAEDIYGEDIPYLQSCVSPFDTMSGVYSSKKTISREEAYTAINKNFDGIVLPEDPGEIISNIDAAKNGTVKTLNLGNKTVTGAEMEKLFSLDSACFEITYVKDKYLITQKGIGSGVGMSIYGANAMALQGADADEIIKHYYKGVSITPMN